MPAQSISDIVAGLGATLADSAAPADIFQRGLLQVYAVAGLPAPEAATFFDLQALVLMTVLPLCAAAMLAFLGSELLSRLFPIRDDVAGKIAGKLGLPATAVTPVADGMQLARDAHRHMEFFDLEAHLPRADPSHAHCYAIHHAGGLALATIHGIDSLALIESRDAPGGAEAPVAVLDYTTGYANRDFLPLEPEEDAARRASLLEAAARAKFGYTGSVRPITLVNDTRGRLPAATDERTVSGLRVERFALGDLAGLKRWLATLDDGTVFDRHGADRLRAWLRRQPARMTPRRTIAKRAVLGAAAGALFLAYGTAHLSPAMLADAAGLAGRFW